jgi:osmoprotectant transport system permease protein
MRNLLPPLIPKRTAVILISVLSALAFFVPLSQTIADDAGAQRNTLIRTGSKSFTESVILGELLKERLRSQGYNAIHREELGGTQVCWKALRQGEIDLYVEYTGTLPNEIFSDQEISGIQELRSALRERNLRMSAPLGFENSYLLGMTKSRAQSLHIRTISDLREHPDLTLGFTNEFLDRDDGWRALKRAYDLPHDSVRGLKHQIAYQALINGRIDVTDFYTTDAKRRKYDLRPLEDDRNFFPDYHAVILYRADLHERAPGAVRALSALQGKISKDQMIDMNAAVSIDRRSETGVARSFLRETFDADLGSRDRTSMADRILNRTGEHLKLVLISMFLAILLAVPLGIASAKFPVIGQGVLGAVGIVQTIPALALLVFMLPFLSVGDQPAIAALFLYSLLPIVRNTFSGLRDIPRHIRESAAALGLPAHTRLLKVELPMASRTILAGIKISGVINVGTATLGALIGAGGYGQPILTGIRLDDIPLILEGAIPASLLALMIQGLFELLERVIVPRGLQLSGDE